MPTLIIFAGANGSGKTTAAERYLKEPNALFTDFINTDEIARGLSPFHPEAARVSAGKIFFERFEEFISQKKSFAFETTLAGATHARFIRQAKDAGYTVHMIYLYLDDPLLNVSRVKIRVKQGGHNVPEEDIKRLYKRSLYNLMNTYWDLCDTIQIYNAGYENKLIAHKVEWGGVSYSTEDSDWKNIKSYRDE